MSNNYETSTTGQRSVASLGVRSTQELASDGRPTQLLTTNTTTRTLRCWKKDYEIVEAFCEKYGMCYGEIVYESAKYNIFFNDVDGDEVECCLSENTGDLSDKPCVKYTDIILYIPLNERNLKTDVEAELLKFCRAKGIIE